MSKLRLVAWIGLAVAATYLIAEWSVRYKSGLHDLRAAGPVAEVVAVPQEPERAALQAQVDKLEQTFGQYRDAKEKQVQDLLRLIANLERQIQVLTAQRAPAEQVAALRAASQPVRWASATRSDLAALARTAGFTKFEVRR